MTPRPEYKDPAKKPIYAEVSTEIKDMLEDIAYSLDKPTRLALETVVRAYYERERIKPRPSRKGKIGVSR